MNDGLSKVELRQQFGVNDRPDWMLTKMVSAPPPSRAVAQDLH